MSIAGLERLQAWVMAKEFAVFICKQILPSLPPEEKWALAYQLRRSAQSIPANIAEGYGRFYYQETVRFCYIARGSLCETLSHCAVAHSLGYLTDDMLNEIEQDGENIIRIINVYIAYLKKSRRGANEPGANIREENQYYEIGMDEETDRQDDSLLSTLNSLEEQT